MGRRNDIDWEGVEKAFRVGHLTLREIGRQFDVEHGSISRRAKRLGWTRDRTEEIQVKTRAALVAAVTKAPESTNERTTPTEVDIEIAVATNVAVVRDHQKTLRKMQALGTRLVAQVEIALAGIESDPAPKTQTARIQAIAVATRTADLLDTINRTLSRAIPLERQAFGIDKSESGSEPRDLNVPLDLDSLERAEREILRAILSARPEIS